MAGKSFGLALAALLLASCAATPPPSAAPSAAPRADWRLKGQAMAAAADARAVEAGLDAMKAGGSAVDAAIAAHAVLGLVEPQSSGLGGGGYMVVYERSTGKVTVYDGRETAPAGATPDMFMQDGKTLSFPAAVTSGRSTGVPGAVAMYKAAHDAHGKRPWADNFTVAEKLASDGFVVSPRLAQLVAFPRIAQGPMSKYPETAAYFYPEGKPVAAGTLLKNPAYAELVGRIATEGPSAFYTGEVARDLVKAAQAEPLPGALTEADLAAYKARVVPALCAPYLTYKVCSAPPSSSGGVAMGMMMGLYERLQAGADPAMPKADAALANFVLAQQLTYADRDHYVADPDFVTVPVAELLDPRYLDSRAKRSVLAPGGVPEPGDPGVVLGGKPLIDMWGRDTGAPQPGTTHLSFVDPDGNAVSLTATVEGPFGSQRMTHGFMLNNEITDFTRNPTVGGKPVANAPAGGKRPRSSMSPTLVFDPAGELFMVTGSPGGNSILGYVGKTLAGVLDWGLTAQEAAAHPNIIARGQTVRVEVSAPGGKDLAQRLAAMGFKVQEVEGEASGIHIIVARADTFEGGADPRREGVAVAWPGK